MRPHVVLSEDIHPVGRAILQRRSRVTVAASTEEADLRSAVADADALVMRARGLVTEAVLDAAPRLKVVGRHGVGLDNIDVAAALRRGIQVVYTPNANAGAVAEHTVASLLALCRHVVTHDAAVRRGDWSARDRLLGTELEGRVVGVLGFGNIGQRVARILHRGFGMRVLYTDQLQHDEAASELGARQVPLKELLRSADAVTVHVPLTAATRGLLDAPALAEMPRHAVLVNSARGGVVDEAALLAACASGQMAGAALDVFVDEPLGRDHPLTTCDRVLLTPHSAAMTQESYRRMSLVVEDVLAVLDGRAPRHPAPTCDARTPS